MKGRAVAYFTKLYQHYLQKDEMGGACSTNGGEEECIQDIGGKARRKETTGKTKTQVGGQY
jgi:hypothetical protein